MKKFLVTSNDLFLIKFNSTSNGFVFEGSELEILGDLIQKYGSNGIDKICRYNHAKMKFEKVSKQLTKQLFSHDTHSIQELKKTNFIK